MILKKISIVLPVILITALMITNGCAKRISTSQLYETGTTERSTETAKSGVFNGEDVIAIAEPSIPSVDVYEEENEGESTLSTVTYKGIKDIYFDFDRYTISDDSRSTLQNNWFESRCRWSGHRRRGGSATCRRGHAEHLALGERR